RRPPRARCRIDQLAQCVAAALAEPQKQSGRQSGRAPSVGLRLVTVGQNRVEDMCSKTGLGRMPALPMAISAYGMKPSVRLAPRRKVVDQLDMPIAIAQRVDARNLIQINRRRLRTR